MEILITSKTHKGKAACVGGLVISNNRFVRLLNPGNWDQYADTDFDIGDVWNINFQDGTDAEPPHIEDVIIQSKDYIREIENVSEFIINSGITIYRGAPNQIFNGRLGWTGSGRFPYVGFESKVDRIPAGTLMRMSLARWWKPEDSDMNERCYLQLSGWY